MSNQIQATGAVKIRTLTGALTASSGVVTSVPLGGANGVATLDSLGKVPLSQLPASVVTYLGTWNAATNTPTLANGVGDVGDLYICNVAGTVNFGAGPITFAVGDWVIYSGTTWQKSSGQNGTVTSVAQTVPTGLTITGSPITTSGTLAIGLSSGYTIPLSTQLVPLGGVAGQILTKNSSTNYDTIWSDNYADWTEQLRDSVKAAVAINKGQAVYISGANGTNQLVSLASNTTEATSSKTLGLAMQTLAVNGIGFVITEGLLGGLDTSTATAGDPVWLGTSGNLIFGLTGKPVAPAHLVYIGVVTRVSSTNGEIYIKVQNGFELNELHNVLITSPLNNEGIFYNSSTSLWENKSIATALGYTPISLTSLSASSPLSYNNTTGAFSISQATTSTNGYLSSIDWNTFNNKLSSSTAASTYVPYTGATSTTNLGSYGIIANYVQNETPMFVKYINGTIGSGLSYGLIGLNENQLFFSFSHTSTTSRINLNFPSVARDFAFPNASGTVALTSDIPSLSGYIQGSGTTNYVPKFTASGTIGNSLFYSNTNVGINTTSVGSYAVNITGSTSIRGQDGGTPRQLTIASGGGTLVQLTAQGYGANYGTDLGFYTATTSGVNANPVMYLTSGNNVGIGTGSPSRNFVVQNSSSICLASIVSNPANIAYLLFGDTDSDAQGRVQYDNSSDSLQLYSAGSEKMRITSGGLVGIGTTSALINESSLAVTSNGNTATFKSTLNGGNCLLLWNSGGTGNIVFGTGSSFTSAGSITSSGTVTSFNVTSDYRLKQDLKDYNGLDLISKIKTYDYQWKADKSRMYGVIAHELKEVIPYTVQNEKDGEEMQQVDYSKLTPILVKAIQEQQTIITDLNERLSKLENK